MAITRTSWLQYIRRLCVAAGMGYLVVLGLLKFFENQMIFPGAGQYFHAEIPAGSGIDEVFIPSATGTDQTHGWFKRRSGSKHALVLFHGNGENCTCRGPSIDRLGQELDCSVLAISYPGYSKSTGKPSEAGCYQSAHASYDWLVNQQQFQPDHIIIMGESLGGAVAVELASQKPHAMLVLGRTFTTIREPAQRTFPFLPIRFMMSNHFDSLSRAKRCCQPVFQFHGSADHLVGIDLGKELHEQFVGPKKFLELPNLDHNFAWPESLISELSLFWRHVRHPSTKQ